ncbi:hypothetical protein RND81_09G096600 [Saponaria officinalis]|uniref:Uncharacterized protein n=1 Tax=Saponaria officinalis TaxID=3572 RepID=A0AAW1IKY6_SAPOF
MGGRQSRAIERNIRAEFEQQLSSIRNEMLSTKASLGASRSEVEVLKQQLSTYQNSLKEMGIQLHKSIDFGKQFVLTSNEVLKLKEQIQFKEEFQLNAGRKLQRMIELEKQVHSCNVEVLSSRNYLEILKMEEKALGENLMSFDKFHENLKSKLEKVMELETLISSINDEILETKSRLKVSKEYENGLRNEVLDHDHFEGDVGMKLGHVLELENQLHMAISQTKLAKDCLIGLENEEDVLKEQLMCCEKFQKGFELKLLEIMRLEKGICSSNNETLFAKESVENLKFEEEVLREELFDHEKLLRDLEMNLRKVIEVEKCLYSSNVEESRAKNGLEVTKEEIKELKDKLD